MTATETQGVPARWVVSHEDVNMRQDERPYLEIRITLIHIVIMIVAVILLGFLLTYLGYKAGKASVRDQAQRPAASIQEFAPQTEEMTVPTETVEEGAGIPPQETVRPTPTDPPKGDTSAIEEELRLHKASGTMEKAAAEKTDAGSPIPAKPVQDEKYFSIQVGAFSVFQNAKDYASRFSRMGYKTEIVSGDGPNGTLYRCWVGQYSDRDLAMREKSKLEKKEKKKFSLVSNH